MSKLTYKFLRENIEDGSFDCGVESINQYVVDSFWATLLQHGYAYQIFYGKIVVGYYMITFNHIQIEDCPEILSEYTSGISNFLYSVEIKYLAIDKKYQRKKIGTSVLPSIIKSIKDCALEFPVRLITIDARNDLIEWYKSLGFVELPYNPEWQNGYTTKMYIDCMIRKKEFQEYLETLYE